MNKQTALDSSYFQWQPRADRPQVAFARHAMEALQRHILAQIQPRIPPRGEESSGLLLGSRDARTGAFLIEDFRVLPANSEQKGSFWREQAGSRLVGIYRTRMSPGLAVAEQDCALVEDILPRHEGVLLLVKPLSATECAGALFLCEGGVVVDEAASEREFTLTPAPSSARARWPHKWLKALVPITAMASGIALAVATHARHQHASEESPVGLAINSSSALVAPKPSPPAVASAATGEQESPVQTAPAPPSVPVKHRSRTLGAKSRPRSGRVRRVFGGITSKASHLWPFRSARQN